MEKIIHPISGETGVFYSDEENNIILNILEDFKDDKLAIVHASLGDREGCMRNG